MVCNKDFNLLPLRELDDKQELKLVGSSGIAPTVSLSSNNEFKVTAP